MRARLVVFPVKGRRWCFSRSIDPNVPGSIPISSTTPSSFSHLFKSLSSSQPLSANAELLVDFASNKMNKAWIGLEKAPQGSFKNKIYGVGLWLLARVKPSEIFLKSITKDINGVEITYPESLNARLVRRRLRHIAMSGAIIHKRYMYGSASLIPVSSVFMVLPLPNIPFFWLLYRTYSHWRAWQGSEKLLQLVSDGSDGQRDTSKDNKENHNSQNSIRDVTVLPWVLRPSKELEKLVRSANAVDDHVITEICKTFHLDPLEVLKYQKL